MCIVGIYICVVLFLVYIIHFVNVFSKFQDRVVYLRICIKLLLLYYTYRVYGGLYKGNFLMSFLLW